MATTGLIQKEKTALLIIDIQEKLMPVIHNAEEVFANTNKLLKGASVLNIPVILTEQYPKGLGNTCAEIELPENILTIEKMCFSCMQSASVIQELKAKNITTLVLCGVESHICVLKTALEALENNFEVHVVADAVSSRTKENKELALERIRQSGAFIVSTEMMLFQLIDEAGTAAFKAISSLIK